MTSDLRTSAPIKRNPFLLIVSICSILTSCNSKPQLSGTYESDEKTITGHPCYTITFLGSTEARFNDYSLMTKIYQRLLFGGEEEFTADYWNDRESVEFTRTVLSETQHRKFKIENGNSVLRDQWDVFRKR